jgi:hypothetical protein
MKYKNTQIGYLMIFVFVAISLTYGIIFLQIGLEEFNIAMIIIMAMILILIASFSTLTITLDEKSLNIRYTYGIFRKKFNINDISSVKSVKNKWYYGWGIRYWPFRKIWIYNVSGFNAIEITMKNGRIYRLGTNEPKKLENAILNVIKRK